MQTTKGPRPRGGFLRVILFVLGALAFIVGTLATLEMAATMSTSSSATSMLVYAIPAYALAFLCFRAARRPSTAEPTGVAPPSTSRLAIGILQIALLGIGGLGVALGLAILFDTSPSASPPDMVRLGRVIGAIIAAIGLACLYAVYALHRRKPAPASA